MHAREVAQLFDCKACKQTVKRSYQSDPPTCCDQPMTPGPIDWPRWDPNCLQLHLVRLRKDPEIAWMSPEPPIRVVEVWKLGPGRANGERIGWLAERATGYEWRAPDGVKMNSGFKPKATEAVMALLEALQGGVHVTRNIAEIQH